MAGVDVEGLPMLDDIEIMKRLDSRGRELQAQLKDKYLAHVYHSEWGLGLSGTCVWQCMGCGFEFVCIQGKMMTSVTCACKEKNGCGDHLQERSLRRPEALEHAVTSAQGVDASRPASVGQSRGAGPCASLPSVEERRGSSRAQETSGGCLLACVLRLWFVPTPVFCFSALCPARLPVYVVVL
eukprot:scaffold128613_cov20-Tisochrysis_lutea.AAC.1